MFRKIIARFQSKIKCRGQRQIVRQYWREYAADARACGLWPTPRPCPVPVPAPRPRPGGGR